MKAAVAARIEVAAADGHRLSAWRAEPSARAKGGVVVLHAVYGATTHMGDVCARWAAAGYTAVAPALFDRIARDRVHAYDKPADGTKDYTALTEAQIFADIAACVGAAGGRAAISGFCTGGTWAWRAAATMDFPAQVNFWGSHIPAFINLIPRCPTILHYGDRDHVVPMAEVEKIRKRHPDVEMHVYAGAGHAFENVEQANYNAVAGDLAWARSIAFMDRWVGNRS